MLLFIMMLLSFRAGPSRIGEAIFRKSNFFLCRFLLALDWMPTSRIEFFFANVMRLKSAEPMEFIGKV